MMWMAAAIWQGCTSSAVDTQVIEDTAATISDREVWDDPVLGLQGVTTALHDEIGSIVYVTWDQPSDLSDVVVEYQVDDGEWRSTPAQSLGAGPAAFMLLGIPFDHTFSYRIREGEQVTDVHMSTTGPHPIDLPQPLLLTADEAQWHADGRFLILSINAKPGGWTAGDYWKIIIDRQGRIVWASLTPNQRWTIFARISQDGDDILWDEASFWSDWDSGKQSVVQRSKIDGSIVETISTPGLHHAFVELADGTLAWGAASSVSEQLVKEDGNGSADVIWDCDRFHAETKTKTNCQSNTLYWHEATDTFLMSFYTTSTVVHIDHQSGETLHYWGQLDGPWTFSPTDALFDWQHGAHFTDMGTLLLSTHTITGELETVVSEYSLDEDSQTLNQIWSFGEGEGLHAFTAGEAHRLPNGNTLHNYGSMGRLREVTEDGTIVWDLAWEASDRDRGHLIGRSIFTDSLYHFAP